MSQPFGQEGAQPLHFAAKAGHTRAVEFLLRRRAELEASTRAEGFTPLHFAAATKLLLKIYGVGFIYLPLL